MWAFQILEKVHNNSYRLNIPPYMCIYTIVNVDNLQLYEPSMLDEDEESRVLPSIEDLIVYAWENLPKDTIMKKKMRMTQRCQKELWQVGLKSRLLTKDKLYSKEKFEEIFFLLIQN
jgi:hypothetical protein